MWEVLTSEQFRLQGLGSSQAQNLPAKEDVERTRDKCHFTERLREEYSTSHLISIMQTQNGVSAESALDTALIMYLFLHAHVL